MDKVNKVIKWLNEHLSLIIAVPAVLGGLWQLISLMAIDPAYIRFFSATQMLADGLLMMLACLSLCSTIICMFLLEHQAKKRRLKNEQNNIEDNNIEDNNIDSHSEQQEPKKPTPMQGLGLLFFVILFGWPLYDATIYLITNKLSLWFFIFIPIIWFFIFLIFGLLTIAIFSFFKRDFTLEKKWNPYIYTFLILFTTWYFYSLLSQFNSSFLVSDTLKNVENVTSLFKNPDSSKKDNFRIVYFNDTYIFLEFNLGKDLKEIKVVKFDEFFNDQNVIDYNERVEKFERNKILNDPTFKQTREKIRQDSLKIEAGEKRIDSLHKLIKEELESR